MRTDDIEQQNVFKCLIEFPKQECETSISSLVV